MKSRKPKAKANAVEVVFRVADGNQERFLELARQHGTEVLEIEIRHIITVYVPFEKYERIALAADYECDARVFDIRPREAEVRLMKFRCGKLI
jgi:hypothetical protein